MQRHDAVSCQLWMILSANKINSGEGSQMEQLVSWKVEHDACRLCPTDPWQLGLFQAP